MPATQPTNPNGPENETNNITILNINEFFFKLMQTEIFGMGKKGLAFREGDMTEKVAQICVWKLTIRRCLPKEKTRPLENKMCLLLPFCYGN